MNRVSTYGSFNSALLDLMTAQRRMETANERVSTQRTATDLGGFGRTAETVTAFNSTHARITQFKENAEAADARLSTQALAFDRIIDGAQTARQAIADALAAGRLDGIMAELGNQFQAIQDGLNTRHQGAYVFAGGRVDQAPVANIDLAALAASPTVPELFNNDTLKQISRVDEGSYVQTGYLANEIGTELYNILRDIQTYHQGTPLTGKPTAATENFLKQQLARLDGARESVTGLAANNGAMQSRVESLIETQEKQLITLEELTTDKTHVDMTRAVTDLQLAQTAIQASAQVVSQLRDSSLLNYLR